MGDSVSQLLSELGVRTFASYVPTRTEPDPEVSATYYPVLFDEAGMLPPGCWGTSPLVPSRRGWPHQPSAQTRLQTIDVALVPALGVDKSGVRLGKGGGWYDRALLDIDAPIFAVVHFDEVLPKNSLPHESHDLLVDGYITETGFSFINR